MADTQLNTWTKQDNKSFCYSKGEKLAEMTRKALGTARRNRNVTLEEFAAEIQVDTETLRRRILRGYVLPYPRLIERIEYAANKTYMEVGM